LSTVLPQEDLSSTVLLVGAACSVIPDLDVIGFKFGVRSPHMLGHRGLTHSIAFAAALGAVLTYTLFRHNHPHSWVVFLFSYGSLKFEGVLHIVVRSRYERDLDYPE
jgi:inner membrane protein